jgi:hypothetical protein
MGIQGFFFKSDSLIINIKIFIVTFVLGWILDGAYEGIRYYIQPNIDQLKNIQASKIFF